MSDALERAKQGLEFANVYQEWVNAWLAEGFDPSIEGNADALHLQFKHRISGSNVIEIRGDGDDLDLMRVFIELGVRFVRGESDASQDAPAAQIESRYRVDYQVADAALKDDDAALAAFAVHNATHHVWPFWREFAMAQGQRMNLPRIALPLQAVPNGPNPPSGQTESD